MIWLDLCFMFESEESIRYNFSLCMGGIEDMGRPLPCVSDGKRGMAIPIPCVW